MSLSRELETLRIRRGAIAPHSSPKADVDLAWGGSAEVAEMDGAEQLRRAHTWVDDEQDPETKQAYKLPHHLATGEVVWRGVAAAMARLLQAGTSIPDADRRGVYNHLARHYAQFDKEPPEFRTHEEIEALSINELRGLFLEGEPEIEPGPFKKRAGAVLSARNKEALTHAQSLIQEVLDSARPKGEVEQEDDDEDNERNLESDEKLEALHRLFTS